MKVFYAGFWGDADHVYIFCPACKEAGVDNGLHCMSLKVHEFDGNYDQPTFKPSLMAVTNPIVKVCHSYVKNGKIEYLSDCTHLMKGQIVELLNVPEGVYEVLDVRKKD